MQIIYIYIYIYIYIDNVYIYIYIYSSIKKIYIFFFDKKNNSSVMLAVSGYVIGGVLFDILYEFENSNFVHEVEKLLPQCYHKGCFGYSLLLFIISHIFILNIKRFFTNFDVIKKIFNGEFKSFFGIFLFYISFGYFHCYISYHKNYTLINNNEQISLPIVDAQLILENLKRDSEYYLILTHIVLNIQLFRICFFDEDLEWFYIQYYQLIGFFITVSFNNYGEVTLQIAIWLFLSGIAMTKNDGRVEKIIFYIKSCIFYLHWLYCWLNGRVWGFTDFSHYYLQIILEPSHKAIEYLLGGITIYSKEIDVFISILCSIHLCYKKSRNHYNSPYILTPSPSSPQAELVATTEINVNDLKCNVCLDSPKNIICKPCNHLCLCQECSTFLAKHDQIKTCIICAGKITHIERIYF
jgi:hypothetical protein